MTLRLFMILTVALAIIVHIDAIRRFYLLMDSTGWFKPFGWLTALIITMMIPRVLFELAQYDIIEFEAMHLMASVILLIDSFFAVYIAILFNRSFDKYFSGGSEQDVKELLAQNQLILDRLSKQIQKRGEDDDG